ncbi:MAG TPA: peptide ABC transporter permease [Clostridiales bacterium UBA8960]|nr:peptide ABC transporter permease [Clostridiales bacterium UBA8960]
MGKYILKRTATIAVSLFVIITITFIMMHAIPGGPFTRENTLPETVLESLNEKYRLNDPLWKQYFDYVLGILRLDFGPSLQRSGVSVNQLIEEGFPATFTLGLSSVIYILMIGVPLGVFSALKHNKWQDRMIVFFTSLGVAVPSFVIATAIIFVFSAKLNILPSNGLSSWKHLIGPVIALSGFSLSFIIKMTRTCMLEVMEADYIRTARSKGISIQKVIFKHALKNATIPVITYVGPMVATLLTGSFVIERIFAIPGIGKHFVESVGNRDYTVLLGITLLYAFILAFMVLVVDVLYMVIDPRIKMKD